MATLQNFGVPMGGGTGRGGILMPKTKWKWRARFFNFGPIAGGFELSQQIQTCSRPKLSQEPQEIHSYNSVAHYLGKHRWDNISITIRDDVTNAVTKLVGHQMQKQMNHFEQTTPLAASNYKFEMMIEMLDGGDGVLETWELEGCSVPNFTYDDLSFAESAPVMLTLEIKYDNATQTAGLMPRVPQLRGGVLL